MEHRRWRQALIGALAVVAIVGAGCGGDDSDTDAAEEDPVRGGTLTWSMSSEPASFDNRRPGGSGSATASVAFLGVYDSLAVLDADSGEIDLRVAESATASPDGKVWTIKLRPNIKFTDGTPYNAAAVKAHWDRMADPAIASSSLTTMRTMTSWEARDELTFVVTLPRSRGSFLELLTGPLGGVPSPTAVATHGDNYGSSPATTVGAGPFKLQEWIRGGTITLVRNPDYWDEGKPYLDTLILRLISDPATASDALRTGTIDITYLSTAPDYSQRLKDEGFENCASRTNSAAYGAMFNFSRAPFDDVRIRRAFVLATDVVDVNTKATQGAAVRAGGPDSAWYPEGHPLHDPDVQQKSNDLPEAQRLIDTYLREKGVATLDIEVTYPAPVLSALGEALLQSWSRLKNVNIRANAQTSAQAQLLYAQSNYQAAVSLLPISTDYQYVDTLYPVLKSGSPQNTTKYSNPKMDALLESGFGVSELDERKKLMNEIGEILFEDAHHVRVYHNSPHNIAADYVGGTDKRMTSAAFFLPDEIWKKS